MTKEWDFFRLLNFLSFPHRFPLILAGSWLGARGTGAWDTNWHWYGGCHFKHGTSSGCQTLGCGLDSKGVQRLMLNYELDSVD